MKYCPFKRNVMNKDYRGCLVFDNDNNIAKVDIEFGECDERKCMAYDHLKCKCN